MSYIIYTSLLLFATIFNTNFLFGMEDNEDQAFIVKAGSTGTDILDQTDYYYSFKVQRYNPIKKNWETLDNNDTKKIEMCRKFNKKDIYNAMIFCIDAEGETKDFAYIDINEDVITKFFKDTITINNVKIKNIKEIGTCYSQQTVENNTLNKKTLDSSQENKEVIDPTKSEQLIVEHNNNSLKISELNLLHNEQRFNKPLYKAILAEAALSWLTKKYLLDNWVKSMKEDDIFFTLATALQRSNSNLSILGFKGSVGVFSYLYSPILLQDNNLYIKNYTLQIKKNSPFFPVESHPQLVVKQIIRTQLLGLAYQTIAPKEYQDGWFAGPVGQFVFEQAAITAARTNPYGICSWIGAELIAGYSPNVTQSTWEKQFKKIVVHQARTSTFLQALRNLHTPFTNKDEFTFKAHNTITKLLATTLITTAAHCAYSQTPCKKRLKELKTTNPNVAWCIKKTGQYGVPFVVDMLFERFVN